MSGDMSKVEGRGSTPARVAFVAGGGAVKAYAYHVGVLRGMEEDGFVFRAGLRWKPRVAARGAREVDTYVGSSAGACVVAAITSGHPVEDLRRALLGNVRQVPIFGYRVLYVPVAPNPFKYVRRLARRLKIGQLRPHDLLDVGGFMTTAGVEKYFRKHVLPTNRFADLAASLYLTATQVNTSRRVVFGPVDSLRDGGYDSSTAYYDNVLISQAIAAAVSIPPVFAPYAIVNPSTGKTFHYYDGEVREALSTNVARDTGADFVIASSIWNPYRYDEQVGTLADFGMSVLAEQAIHQAIEQKVNTYRRRSRSYDQLLELIEQRDRRLAIAPHETDSFQRRVRDLLRHRPARSLYVLPDPADRAFFFSSSFRFSSGLVQRCVDAGYRAYRRSVRQDPEFLEELDAALVP